MTSDEKLAAIIAAVQTDPGNRGLARDPEDNLFSATMGDYEKACRKLSKITDKNIFIGTGFYIPSASCFETDGPLGTVFLIRALWAMGYASDTLALETSVLEAVHEACIYSIPNYYLAMSNGFGSVDIHIERAGPARDGKCYTMRGKDTTPHLTIDAEKYVTHNEPNCFSIGIGDGGNEIGMGKIPHETIVKNIPNGDVIHCRVPTDHLIVAGVSNWGAYALAAGIFVLKGITPPDDLFDPDREQEILEVMVKAGPLVDGVTGEQTATVDGLTWEEYVKPLVRIRDILAS